MTANRTFTTGAETYEIVVEGHLDTTRSGWFEGMQLSSQPDGTTRLTGLIVDQSALFGLLNRIRDLGLPLISVQWLPGRDQNQ
jgi:hypothetical protein